MNDAVAKPQPVGRRTRRAQRIDFLLLTANDDEADAASDLLGLQYEGDHPEVPYDWGYIANNTGRRFSVATVSLEDNLGKTHAFAKSEAALNLLHPQYFIVLGIAAGVKTDQFDLKPGDIVYSNLVRTGPAGPDNRLREEPIHQPSPALARAAKRIANRKTWQKSLNSSLWEKALFDSELPKTTPLPRAKSGEVVSADRFVLPHDTFVSNCVHDYRKLAAFDMEAGGVGLYLQKMSDHERPPSYLFVKSISDIVYDSAESAAIDDQRRTELEAKNYTQRKLWKPFASHAAVVFVHNLISNFRSSLHSPMHPDNLYPPTSEPSMTASDGTIGIYTAVESEAYSDITDYILKEIAADVSDGIRSSGDEHFFTVCAFSPRGLWDEIVRTAVRRNRPVANIDDVYRAATDLFPHFETFIDHNKRYPRSGVRILLLEDFGSWLPDKKRGVNRPTITLPEHWKLFLRLNGYNDDGSGDGLPFWGVDRKSLVNWSNEKRRFRFLTDYVVLGRDLVLDYYSESGMLVASEGIRNAARAYFMGLHQFFLERQVKGGDPFVSHEELHRKATDAFKSEELEL
jgi:nucleoside phosphorylase